MGYWSERHIELQEEQAQEEKKRWIRKSLCNEDANEQTPGWHEKEIEYDFLFDIEVNESDVMEVLGKTRYFLFSQVIENSEELLNVKVSGNVQKNLLVMLYGHIIAATEAYLAATFINAVNESEDVLKKLIRSDPIFAERKFTIAEIFDKKDTLKADVITYLKNLIFHEIHRVKPMYKDVLDIDFGDVGWLFQAVKLRHDCVHRAGYDKDGNEIDITADIVKDLIDKCKGFVDKIENDISFRPSEDEMPF
jgi:hypothetical protein